MTAIYKKDTGRLKVAEAKRLIVEAMPDDEPGYVAFSCAVDADGNERWDFDNPKHQTYRETVQRRLNNSFLDLCQKAGFEPHLSIDPSAKGYRLSEADDHLYMVTHAQFVKLAEAFSLTVVVGDEPDATPAPVVTNPTESVEDARAGPAKRRTWRDVAWPYMVSVFKSGQYATAKEFYRALETKAGVDSPFESGTGPNRGSLFVRETSEKLTLKTVQNTAWPQLK